MKNIIKVTILIAVFIITSGIYNLVARGSHKIADKSQCSSKNGYWYKDKCWEDYEDSKIPDSEIDSVVAEQMKKINKLKITMDKKKFPIVGFLPLGEDDEEKELIAVFGDKGKYQSLLFETGKKTIKENEIFKSKVIFFNGSVIGGQVDKKSKLTGTADVTVIDYKHVVFKIEGRIKTKKGKIKKFSFLTDEAIVGGGSSSMEIKGKEAYLSGSLGTITYAQIKDLLKNHPQVKTLVLGNIPGSLNDDVNMHTGRLVREGGLTTKVLSGSHISSGGVDLFTAGKKRIVEKGAKIGVHSWCCVNNKSATELPKDHPAHKDQLEYFTMTLGSKLGPGFYFFTLESAPFDGMHYMSDKEIKKWNIATEFIK